MLRRIPTLLLLAFVLLAADRPAELSEAGRWLQGYLRIDTTNPPGREDQAAAYLAEILRREGIPVHVARSANGRANLWARLSSPRSNGRALVLLHHMDVVSPGPGWTVPPFSGEVRDGRLWAAAPWTTRAWASPSSRRSSTSSGGGSRSSAT